MYGEKVGSDGALTSQAVSFVCASDIPSKHIDSHNAIYDFGDISTQRCRHSVGTFCPCPFLERTNCSPIDDARVDFVRANDARI
jgi:hypothetical protein